MHNREQIEASGFVKYAATRSIRALHTYLVSSLLLLKMHGTHVMRQTRRLWPNSSVSVCMLVSALLLADAIRHLLH